LLLALPPLDSLASAAAKAPTPSAKRKVSMVKLQTNFGPITLELDAKAAPETVANFLQYVKDGHYDGTIFHRVIDGFMIQGGGFTADMEQKPTRAPIQNEAQNGLKNLAYSIAMARTPTRILPAASSSSMSPTTLPRLPRPTAQGYGYCVFGKVDRRPGCRRPHPQGAHRHARRTPGCAGGKCGHRARRNHRRLIDYGQRANPRHVQDCRSACSSPICI
jgi:cyclophilin family peptidyl-prolyl cis-trans isomerase